MSDGKLISELRELAPEREPQDGRESSRERRHSAQRSGHAGLSRLCREGVQARHEHRGSHSCAGDFSPRRHETQRGVEKFPGIRPRRDCFESLGCLVSKSPTRVTMEPIEPTDEHLSRDGRVMEVLSEHMCQGWLEGYLLTGRHGFFSCYEAFIHIVDSMFNQHAKWLKVTRNIPWRRPIASLNYLLTSHVWRQDHNGFTHQDPGFIDHVVNKKADIVRVYLPPDANTLLSVADHCLRSRDYVNVIVAGKQPALQYLDMQSAIEHCTDGSRHLGMGIDGSRVASPMS